MIENFDEVKTYITENLDKSEDVKNYIGGFITPDRVENFLNTEDGKKLLQPKLDKYHTKGLETWKQNNLSKMVDDEVKKRFPAADPKDTALAQLKAEMEQMKADNLHKDLTAKALKIATEKKIPTDLIDFVVGADEESTKANLDKLTAIFSAHDEAIRKEFAKGNSYTPPSEKKTDNLSGEDKIREEIRKQMGFKK